MVKNIFLLILQSLSDGKLTAEEAFEILLYIFNFESK